MTSNLKGPLALVPSVPRMYGDVLKNKQPDYWDYEHLSLKFGNQENYELLRKVGQGKYSDVFEAMNLQSQTSCVIKVLKAVKKKKIKREMKILENLRGGPNIIRVLDMVRDPTTDTPAFVMELVHNADYRALYPTFTTRDIQYYMFRLLSALDYAHSNGIMHRDVKPHNVVIDPHKRILKLIDWGLAEFYFTFQDYNVKVASRYFKAPELLVDYIFYDYAIDMWSFGCMFAGLIFRKEPFFRGADNDDQLVKIVRVLGMHNLKKYAAKYHIQLDPKVVKLLEGRQKRAWEDFVNTTNRDVASSSAINLIDNLLVFDHSKRFTAREALNHGFFHYTEPSTFEGAEIIDLSTSAT